MSSSNHPKTSHCTALDIKEICKIIPHRYPFLLIDKILELDLEKGTVIGLKNLTMNELFFQGHFPNNPIMPGVLSLEALAQTGGLLVHQKANTDRIAVLLNINNVKFRSAAHPGDTLIIKCEGLHFSSKGGRVKGEILVEDKIIVQAEISFALVDADKI